ncbi:MAG: thioredoxin domain-containing protein [Deltaproteobacteria bacterium]|nr:thioredoxin domain-containing protein [Deltaproteobacteria bacterium]
MRNVTARLALFFVVSLAITLTACGASLPSVIRDEMASAPHGVVTIVFFTDFQCPHCRRTHAALAPLLEQYQGKVRLVLRHVPLKMHRDARTAARAATCGEKLGAGAVQGIDLPHALFMASDLGDQATEALVLERGVDRDAYRRCLADPATEARIQRDDHMLDEVGGEGVPLLFVGSRRLDGAQSREALASAIEAELSAAGGAP